LRFDVLRLRQKVNARSGNPQRSATDGAEELVLLRCRSAEGALRSEYNGGAHESGDKGSRNQTGRYEPIEHNRHGKGEVPDQQENVRNVGDDEKGCD